MSPAREYTLDELTGLAEPELADVFSKNPRTYMAVKGAVAEKHLEKQLTIFKQAGLIESFRGSISDFDKDFYVNLGGGTEIILECKNVEVLKINGKTLMVRYLFFLMENGYVSIDRVRRICCEDEVCQKKIKSSRYQDFFDLQGMSNFLDDQYASFSARIIKCLPQELRESGMPRYEFSKSFLDHESINEIDSFSFLKQFNDLPLSIDFQRTRNSTDSEGDNRRGRLYEVGEVDIVGACLFSRTLRWEFIYGLARNFTTHKTYPDRYKNGLVIDTKIWITSFEQAIALFMG